MKRLSWNAKLITGALLHLISRGEYRNQYRLACLEQRNLSVKVFAPQKSTRLP
jgi:hypothetical protein